MSVELRAIDKSFGSFTALDHVDLQIHPGELLGLLGPSGSGKTTLLRIIGGLEIPDSGKVLLHGEVVTQKSPAERNIGFVFQNYALFRHMTVFENVAFGLEVRRRSARPSKATIRTKVSELLTLVQLEGLEERLPAQLSGGQRQRVALARALAIEPKVLLLDEPFGALDAKVRKDLRRWIRRLHREIHVTSIFVTHDQDEALEVADRVVVMNQGHIEQIGTPDEVYETPSNPFVYNFLGRVLSLRAEVRNGQLQLGGRSFALAEDAVQNEGTAVLFARPQDISIAAEPDDRPSLEVLVKDLNYAGPMVYLELERQDDRSTFQVELPSEGALGPQFRPGVKVYVSLARFQVFVGNDHPIEVLAENEL